MNAVDTQNLVCAMIRVLLLSGGELHDFLYTFLSEMVKNGFGIAAGL